MGFLMPNNNRYEISEALQMPLPLTKEEAMQETLTQEESAARRFPILPSNANVTVIPIIPGITLFGYIRFLNASPVETRVDIQPGDTVRILSGLFENFSGRVVSVNEQTQTINVMVLMFKQETPVELGFDEVVREE